MYFQNMSIVNFQRKIHYSEFQKIKFTIIVSKKANHYLGYYTSLFECFTNHYGMYLNSLSIVSEITIWCVENLQEGIYFTQGVIHPTYSAVLCEILGRVILITTDTVSNLFKGYSKMMTRLTSSLTSIYRIPDHTVPTTPPVRSQCKWL